MANEHRALATNHALLADQFERFTGIPALNQGEQILLLLARLDQKIGSLTQDVAVLKQEVRGLRQEVRGLKQEVGGLKQKIDGHELRFDTIDARFDSMKLGIQTHIAAR